MGCGRGEAEEGGEERRGEEEEGEAVYVGVLCSLFFFLLFFLHSAFCPAKKAAVLSAVCALGRDGNGCPHQMGWTCCV